MSKAHIISELVSVLGDGRVTTNAKKNEHYRTGWRSGGGSALAVVFPQTLVEFWQVLESLCCCRLHYDYASG